MNDEKKLNEKKLDDKTLEEVTGGNSQWEYSEDEGNFIVANCIGYCVYEGPGAAPTPISTPPTPPETPTAPAPVRRSTRT